MSFAIRNKATLRTLMQIYLAIYMALQFFFLARFARSVFKTLIKYIVQSGTQIHTSHSYYYAKLKQQHFIITFNLKLLFFLNNLLTFGFYN